MDEAEMLCDEVLLAEMMQNTHITLTRVMKDIFTYEIVTSEDSELYFDTSQQKRQYHTLSEIIAESAAPGAPPFASVAKKMAVSSSVSWSMDGYKRI